MNDQWNFILFDKSAVEFFASRREFQSTEFDEGSTFIDYIRNENGVPFLPAQLIVKELNKGTMFIGPELSKQILVIDLVSCDLIRVEKDDPDNLLLVIQRMFRAALRAWLRQPFTGMERVNNSKLVLFPYHYNLNKKNNKRLVIEREVNSRRLLARGVVFPLLVYKYNDETVLPGSSEVPKTNVINEAGKAYIDTLPSLASSRDIKNAERQTSQIGDICIHRPISEDGGFRYKNFELQYSSLTTKQKAVVDYPETKMPIRISGPAGTGKTTSMILRAYKMLRDAKADMRALRIIFITHSQSTRHEAETAFRLLDDAEVFLNQLQEQTIEFITLLSYCKRYRRIPDVQTIDDDAAEAKDYQLYIIEESIKSVKENEYRAYRNYLSEDLKQTLEQTNIHVLTLLFQHEFSIQIKGRADGLIENYRDIPSIKNGLPVSVDTQYQDKNFVYAVFRQYESHLRSMAVYDTDDIAIEALMSLNAPIWRRERSEYGYDCIFVDEIHLFNLNEQHIFHFLTKNASETPICFALDYSQTIGDRGDLSKSYIENQLSLNAFELDYNTVFRNSKYIMEFCTSLIASGVMLFQSDFINPYKKIQPASVISEENSSDAPRLVMSLDEEDMINRLKAEIDYSCKTLQCKNYQIVIVSFDEKYLRKDNINTLQDTIGRPIYYLEGRNVGGLGETVKESNSVIVTSPYNINGLEFEAVILLGVDGARVPPSSEVNNISRNYLRYNAYNMLYLASSRAKNLLIVLGNRQNGISECLEHSIQDGSLTLFQD